MNFDISRQEETRNMSHIGQSRLMKSILCMALVFSFSFSFLSFLVYLAIQKEFTVINISILCILLMCSLGSAYVTDILDAWIFFRWERKDL